MEGYYRLDEDCRKLVGMVVRHNQTAVLDSDSNWGMVVAYGKDMVQLVDASGVGADVTAAVVVEV